MPIEVDSSQVHSIEVDPGQVSAAPSGAGIAPGPGAASRFVGNFAAQLNPFPALKHYLVDAPAQDREQIHSKLSSGDYMGALGSLLKAAAKSAIPGSDLVPDVVAAQAHQFVSAYRDFNDKKEMPALSDRVMSAAGHAAAGLLPMVGPADANAGEQIGSGDVAGGLGAGAGLVGGLLLGEGTKAVAGSEAVEGARNAAADSLRTSAEKNIATAINPTTKVNKALVANQLAPGIIDRGIRATSLQELQAQAQAGMEKHGQVIDDIFDRHADAGTKISPKPILADLDAAKQEYLVDGVNMNPAKINKLQQMQDQVQAISDANKGEIPLASLRRVKQIQDETVAASKGGFALSPDDQSIVAAHKTFGNSIRSTFADTVPALSEPSKEFNFHANLDKVVGDSLLRKTGQRAPLTQKLLEMTGTAVGSSVGGPAGAIIGREAGGALGRLQHSTLWNTLSAQVKAKAADLISSGDEAGAEALVSKASNGASAVPDPVATPAAAVASSKGLSLNDGPTQTSEGRAIPEADRGSAQAGTGTGGGGRSSATSIPIPGQPGAGFAAEYKLKELADLNASHNGLTFNKNAEYKLSNDRDYANAVNQGKVIAGASRAEFNPAYHLTDNPDASNGPIVTDVAGNVMGGNGRKMILDRVYGSNPKGAAAYRDALTKKAGQFGIDPAQVAAMKQPVLTREIPESQFVGPDAKQTAVTNFNKKPTAELTPAERAISDSRRVSAGTLADVSSRLDAKGENATVADVLAGKSGGEVLAKLIDDGVVSPQERGAFSDSSGELTAAGKDRISKLMIGRFFRDPAHLDSVAPAIRNQVERISAPLAQVESKPSWSLTSHVQDALEIVDRIGAKNLDDFLATDGLFGKDRYSPETITLARALRSMPAAKLKAAARQYASDAAYASKGVNTLMGDAPTPADSFRDAFGKPAANTLSSSVPATRASTGKLMYRGAESPDLEKGHFGGTFLSSDKAAAAQYGPVHAFNVQATKFLSIDDPGAEKLATEYLSKHPNDAPNADPEVDEGAPPELWMFPTSGWAKFLKSKGYEGTAIGKDHFVFDAANVQHIAPKK